MKRRIDGLHETQYRVHVFFCDSDKIVKERRDEGTGVLRWYCAEVT